MFHCVTVQGGYDRSFIAADPTADSNGFKFALADPTSGSCSLSPTSGTVPADGAACTVQGSVAWNIQKWFEDDADWVLYCTTGNVWANVASGKKKSTFEEFDADKRWLRIDVDTTNKPDNSPDDPSSWLKGEATGLAEMNNKCDDAEPSTFGHGGSLFICLNAMTNSQTFVGMICSKGVTNDTPTCGGHVGLNEGDITTSSADCPLKA